MPPMPSQPPGGPGCCCCGAQERRLHGRLWPERHRRGPATHRYGRWQVGILSPVLSWCAHCLLTVTVDVACWLLALHCTALYTGSRAENKPKKVPALLLYSVAGLVVACVALFLVALWAGRGDLFPSAGDSMPCSDGASCAPVLRVFIGWVGLYFSFLFSQSYRTFNAVSKGKGDIGAVKYGNAGGKYILTGNRTVANMMEQSFPFLASLALHALLVDAASAAQLGWLWLFSRTIYPLVFAMGPPMLFLSTLPGYVFLGMLTWPVGALAFA